MKITKTELKQIITEEYRKLVMQEGSEEFAMPDPDAGDTITDLANVLTQAGIKFVWLQSGEDFWLPDSKLNITVHQSREPQGNPMLKSDLAEQEKLK